MIRTGVIQVWQESNSFNPVLTTDTDFQAIDAGDEVSGFVSGLDSWRDDVMPVPLFLAQAWPGGPITSQTRRRFEQVIVEQIDSAGPLDALFCSLHGALIAEDESDVDGALLEQIRNAADPDTPLIVSLDLHAHLTPRMANAADVIVAYLTNPHVDRVQTGERAARALERIVRGSRPTTAVVRLPMLATGEVMDTTGPVLAPLFRQVREIEAQADVLSAAVLMTNCHLDMPDLGWTTIVCTDDKPDMARRLAEELATTCWLRREELVAGNLLGAKESVAAALACEGKPIVIADGADATNSGACGDSVHLLQELVETSVPDGALTVMIDPQAVAHATTIGVGAGFEFAVGGKRDSVFSKPLPVTGQVISVQPLQYVLSGHLGQNTPVDMGASATVTTGDVTLLLVERTGPGSSPTMYRCVGLEPKDYKIVVVKSPAGFRAEYEPFAAGIILSACPGCASPRLDRMPYRNLGRPVWPLDTPTDRRNVEWVEHVNRSFRE